MALSFSSSPDSSPDDFSLLLPIVLPKNGYPLCQRTRAKKGYVVPKTPSLDRPLPFKNSVEDYYEEFLARQEIHHKGMKHKIRRLTGEKIKYSEENETLYWEWVMYEEEKQGKQSISDSVRGKALTAYAAKKEERKGNSLNLPGPSPRGLTKISSFHGPTLTNPLLLTGRVKADLVLLSL